MPLVRQIPGMQQIYVFVNAETNQGGTLAIYDSEASAQAAQTNGTYQQALGKPADAIVIESNQRMGCEVFIAETL